MLIKSWFEYLTVWIKDSGLKAVKIVCEEYTLQTPIHIKQGKPLALSHCD